MHWKMASMEFLLLPMATNAPFSSRCAEYTNKIVEVSQQLMKAKNINPKRIRMAALCSVCAEPFANHMENFGKILANLED